MTASLLPRDPPCRSTDRSPIDSRIFSKNRLVCHRIFWKALEHSDPGKIFRAREACPEQLLYITRASKTKIRKNEVIIKRTGRIKWNSWMYLRLKKKHLRDKFNLNRQVKTKKKWKQRDLDRNESRRRKSWQRSKFFSNHLKGPSFSPPKDCGRRLLASCSFENKNNINNPLE